LTGIYNKKYEQEPGTRKPQLGRARKTRDDFHVQKGRKKQ
jgi:hypothetical protein